MKTLVSVAALVGAMLAPTFANAAVTDVSTFYFSGLCVDCSAVKGSPVIAVAELNLANYNIGDLITSGNFVSFHYDGTNLVPGGFTLTSSDAFFVSGSISEPLPGPENVAIGSFGYTFSSDITGGWSVTNFADTLDVGVAGTYSSSPAVVSGVPETSTWAMMLLGFGGLGFLAYRKTLKSAEDVSLIAA